MALAVPPILVSSIQDRTFFLDTGEYEYDLSQFFTGASTFAIDPAVETGWDFDTNTGILAIDTDDDGDFGPYVVTATNENGDTDSNEFSIEVTEAAGGRGTRLGYGFGFGART